MGDTRSKDERKAATAEKQRRALALRRGGATYDQISKELGYAGASRAYNLVKDAIAAIPREEAIEVREMELQRLDVMLVALWPKARAGHAESVDRILRIMKRRAEYLGLDAPKKQEHSGPDGGPIELDAAGERVRSRLALLAARAGTGEATPGDSSDPE